MEQRSLAILGLGSRSTLFYLAELNKHYLQKKGGYSTCPFTLLNTNFDGINSLLPNPSKPLETITQQYITDLEKMEGEHLLIPNITLHETIDRLTISKHILHPVHLTVSKLKAQGWNTVVLFGSMHSMQSAYIRSIFNSNGIEVSLPSTEDMLTIDDVRKQVYAETETISLIEKYHSLIETYSKTDPVVLACTELSILKPKQAHQHLLDMAQVQIKAAVDCVL
jgi:aspartate racemase